MTKKRHHYIPQFYLKGFVDPSNEPFIWVYDKDTGEIIRSTARDIAVKRHYFSFVNEQGEKDTDTIEDMTSYMENKTSEILRKIFDYKLLKENEKEVFALFVADMMIRVPGYRKQMEILACEGTNTLMKKLAFNKERFESYIKQYEKETGNNFGLPIEQCQQDILDGKYFVKIDQQSSHALAALNFGILVKVFSTMKWTFFKTTKEYKFLSGDQPVFYYDPTHSPCSLRGIGLMNKNIKVTLALSRKMAALGSWNGCEGYIQANNNDVKNINTRTVISALRFVFASEKSEALKRFIVKYKGSSPEPVVS